MSAASRIGDFIMKVSGVRDRGGRGTINYSMFQQNLAIPLRHSIFE